MHFYTSINNNYFAKARVLAKSIKKYCKNSKFSLVLSDELPNEINLENEPFDEIINIKNLEIPVDNLDLWIYMHTVVELCTAVKGQALVRFLESGSDKVIYLDPDTAVFNDLHELEELLNKHDVVLTPHQTTPENNREDIINNEICSLQHGAYNFGFYAVKNSENGLKFARWWRDRLVEFCYDDIPGGIFTDQKWGDIAPAMFDGIYILRDPGYNVSTWNLTNRFITKSEGENYLVNGVELKFYHFSGFDSGAQIKQLSKYADGNQNLYDLRDWYIKEQDAAQQSKYGAMQCKYNFYDDGNKVEKDERLMLRKRPDVLEYFKDINPYIVSQEKSYYKWCNIEIVKIQDNIKLEDKIDQLTKENVKAAWKNDEIKKENDNLNNEIMNLSNEITNLNNEIMNLNNEITNLNNEISNLNNERIMLKNENDNLNTNLSSLNEENDKLKYELNRIYNMNLWKVTERVKKFKNKIFRR